MVCLAGLSKGGKVLIQITIDAFVIVSMDFGCNCGVYFAKHIVLLADVHALELLLL